MNRLFRALVVLASLSPLACSAADTAPYQLGTHYQRVREAQLPTSPGKIEVMEVYAYSCPHCFALEPALKQWVKTLPKDVEFVRSPNSLGHPENMMRNQAYYAAKLLGVVDRFHPAMFNAVHVDHKRMATADEIKALFVQATGVKAEEYDGAAKSFAVDAGMRRGENSARAMGITAVPTIVVDGKYFTSGGMGGGGLQGMLKIADFLIEQARKERAKR